MKHFKLLLASFALIGAADATAQSYGDIIEIDGKRYEVTSDNLIYNPSFEDGVDGWYSGAWNNASASNYTLQAEGGFDGGAYLQYSAGGVGSDKNIRNTWNISPGETYLFRCYTSGKTPASNNFQYSKLWASKDGAEETTTLYQLQWGAAANQTSDTWTENNYIFTATTSYVVFRSSWTENAKLDGFFLGTVQLYIDDTAYQNALQAANDALADSEYSNVIGDEFYALNDAITTYGNATPEQYEEAIKALDEATAAFKAAKASYDTYYNTIDNYYFGDNYYGTSEIYNNWTNLRGLTPTSAADADAKTAAYLQALRAVYESHALAEGYDGAVNMTDKIQNPNATDGNNGWTWTGNKNNPRNTESWTDANGKKDYMYFDGGNWNGTGWTTTMEQKLTLPAGYYMLTAKGRASDGVTLTMSVGENSVALPNVNASGNVFDRGWNDGSVEFETQGEEVTIKVTATTEGNHQWFSVGDFRLVRLNLYEEMADATDYAALNDAITAAEGKALGFDAGEYAPYHNIEALQALADAKAIDQNVENGKEQVTALINKLDETMWEANEVELNAVYDGTLANAPIQATSENVVLPGWVTKSGNTRQTFIGADNDNGGKAALADADDQVGLFVHPGTYNYGETFGYTMPLKGGVTYLAQAKYCAWANESNNNFTLTILKDGATVASQSYGKNGVACTEAGALKNVKLYFTPEQDGDYVLSVIANGNTFMTDFYIMRANVEDVVLEDAATEAPTAEFGNVTYARNLVAGYNTLVLPFDVTAEELGENVEAIYTYGGSTLEGDVCHLDFSQKVTSLAANTPYIVKMAALQEGLSFTNKEFKTVAEPIKTDANFDFVGTYVALPAGNETIVEGDYVSAASGLKPATAGKKLNAFRAFLKKKAEVPAGAKVAIMIGDEVVDGIQAAQIINNVDGTIYNLNGQKVINAQKGIFIQNGKKVVIK